MLSVAERNDEVSEFMRFALAEFPALRDDHKSALSRRCSRCIASERMSVLVDGLCAECRENPGAAVPGASHERTASAAEVLRDVLRQYSGAGRGRYDGLVMFSGGKDSTYLLHELTTQCPELRVLAVTVDSGFHSAAALANVRRVTELMPSVDFMVFHPHAELYKRAFRYALLHPQPRGCFLTVDLLDGELTGDICNNVAASLEIPLIFSGASVAQLKVLGIDSIERDPRTMCVRRTHTSAGLSVEELSSERDQKWWWDGSAWPQARVPRKLFPFQAWGYNEPHIRSEVVRLGYIEVGNENPLLTNNHLIPLLLWLDFKRLGYSSFEPEFAALTRQGRIDRNIALCTAQAMEYLARQGRLLPAGVADCLARLDLTAEQLVT